MNGLITLRRNEPFTNSMVIAKGTKNEHHAVQQMVRKYTKKLERWGKVEFKHSRCENPKGGRPPKVYYLNEPQATFLVTLLGNNDVVVEFKAELVDQFYKMRKLLLEKQSESWKEARLQGKQVRREFTDSIKDYVALAEAQGHHGTAKYAYSNITKLVKKPFGDREGASSGTLAMIATTEHILGNTLSQMVSAGADAKEAYWKLKEKAGRLSVALLEA